MRIKLCYLSYIIILFYGSFVFAQDTAPHKPLLNVLNELQDRFQVQFNYASELIEGVSIKTPDQFADLEQAITYLREHTDFEYTPISDTMISVTAKLTRICGYVRDKDSEEPLSFTTIEYEGKGIVANADGYFDFTVADTEQTIILRHIGYKPFRSKASAFKSGKCAVIQLQAEQEVLSKIVLSHYLIQGIDKLDNGSFQLDFKKFSTLPGLVEDDVLLALQALPGIQSADETVSNINIRGGSNDQNLILWDGIKMYQSGHFFGLISMFNPQITRKVSLQKNGTSAAFTEGVSGVISMASYDSINKELQGTLGINLIEANGFVDVPLGANSSIQIASRNALSDLIETPTYSEYFDRVAQDTEIQANEDEVRTSDVKFDFYDTSLRFLYLPRKGDLLKVNFMTAGNEVVFNESAQAEGRENIRESRLNQSSVAAGLYYKRKWNTRLHTEINIYETDYNLKAINANVLQDQRLLQKNIVSETGARFQGNYQLRDRLLWRSGYQFTETKVTNLDDVDNPFFQRLKAEVLRSHGLFSEMGWKSKGDNTSLNAGVRLNYLGKFEKVLLEPRLSFNQSFLDHFNLEVLGEFKHQTVSQVVNFQNDFLGVEKRRWQLANDETFPVIQSKQGSVGVSYQNYRWLFNAVGYVKEVQGITSRSQGFTDRYEYENAAGNYDAYGIDLLLRKQFRRLNSWFSYAYLNSTYQFSTLPESGFRNNFDITHSVSSGITYSVNNLNIAFGANWRTGKPYTPLVSGDELANGELNYAAANSAELDHYLRFDFSVNYRSRLGKNSSVQTGLSLWNILDRENQVNTFFRENPQANAQQVLQQALGFTPNAAIKIFLN